MAAPARPAPTRLQPRSMLFGFGAVVLVLGAAVVMGPVTMPAGDVIRDLAARIPGVDLASPLSDREAAVLWELRIPRAVLGGLVGATLAMAGAAYQGVFRNPLADPYLLGVAAGAGLGATAGIVLGVAASSPLIPALAFVGGLVAVSVTYGIGRMGGGGRTATLILAGVAVAAFFTALQTFMQQLSSDTIREVFAWILGRLTTVGWREVLVLAPFVAVSAGALTAHRRHLDVLAVGEDEAATLGLDVTRVRVIVVLAATLATAAAVAVSGLIGFVGIIVPHTVRLIVGPSYRRVIPLSFLGGAAFLMFADVIARTVLSPAEIPIGVVTAFFGVPFFIVVLATSRELPR